jgi:predicted NAD/FAD-binding protein
LRERPLIANAVAALGGGRRRIAVVGTGIAGLVAARLLARDHDVTVFEAEERIGGHTHTVDVDVDGRTYAIDTGFIVFNDRNYPNFTRMLGELGVDSRQTTMSFSMRCDRTGLEYCGSQRPSQLFAQRRNLVRPRFWGMLRDILRFHREAPGLLQAGAEEPLGELLERGGYGRAFVDQYLVPMGAAVWSADPRQLLTMPAEFLIRFFKNHGMLQVGGRPSWRTVVGGSRSYLQPLVAPFQDSIRTGAPVESVRRVADGVRVSCQGGGGGDFCAVVMAAHSDQSLRMIEDPSPDERTVLASVRYQPNDVVLHTDPDILPRRRRAWAAWNYHVPEQPQERVAVTYCMNLLQGFPVHRGAPVFNVTLNESERIEERRVLRRFVYDHPIFDRAAVSAQQRVPQVNGSGRIWFCGAWCGYGFHEDGVVSALRVASDFGLGMDDLSWPTDASRPVAGVSS